MPPVQNYASDAAVAAVYGSIGAIPADDQPDIAKQTLVAVCQIAAAVGTGGSTTLNVSDADTAPAENAAAVTPGAGALSDTTRALYVGGAGNMTVTMAGNAASVTFTAVPAGTTLPIAVTHVTAATATSIVALW